MLEYEGLTEFMNVLDAMRERAEDPTPAFRADFEVLSQSITENFNAEGRPTPWPPRKDNLTHPILDRTGHLRDSAESTQPGSDSIARMTINAAESSAEFGTECSYGKYHQSTASRTVMPWRPFLFIHADDAAEISEIHRQHCWWGK